MNLLEARRAFGDLPVVEMGTTMADGTPHVVPLWFLWRDEAIYVSARRTSSTWRNVERDGRVALSFHRGRRWGELSGAVLYGRADCLSPNHPALHAVMSEWFAKYRRMMDSLRRYAEEVQDPGILRVRPERIAFWDHAAVDGRSPARRSAGGSRGPGPRR